MSRRKSQLGVKLTGGLEEEMTPWAGASLLIELGRQCRVMETADRVLPQKKSAKGLKPWQMMESFVVLSALGGECPEDMGRLRGDQGLEAMLGYHPPAAETARQWLDGFHDEALMAERPLQGCFLPKESKSLAALKEVERREIWAYVAAAHPGWEVTLDVDANVVETSKQGAEYCYEGCKAFHPIKVSWAETNLVLMEEFREGNIPASKDIKRVVNEAFEMLPPGPWQVMVRSDSAGYDQGNLDWWEHLGWRFAVSADMTRPLRAEIEVLPEGAWSVWKEEKRGTIREWAEVPYVPNRRYEGKEVKPYRYVAVRVRSQQGELFGNDGEKVRCWAIVSNIWEMDGSKLLEWHRKKCGTIEHIHHVLKNELGAGVYPSGKHGANAAWLRIQVITHNLLELLKAVALPPEYADARPKRLRFAVFTQLGKVIHHAGQRFLQIIQEKWQTLIGPGHQMLMRIGWDTG